MQREFAGEDLCVMQGEGMTEPASPKRPDSTHRAHSHSRPRLDVRPRRAPATPGPATNDERERGGTGAAPASPSEAAIRDAWLRAEACCECVQDSHGHGARCNQFLIWAERRGMGKGAWEVRGLHPGSGCVILCAACAAQATGHSAKAQ